MSFEEIEHAADRAFRDLATKQTPEGLEAAMVFEV
jgi:hypothetical protein